MSQINVATLVIWQVVGDVDPIYSTVVRSRPGQGSFTVLSQRMVRELLCRVDHDSASIALYKVTVVVAYLVWGELDMDD